MIQWPFFQFSIHYSPNRQDVIMSSLLKIQLTCFCSWQISKQQKLFVLVLDKSEFNNNSQKQTLYKNKNLYFSGKSSLLSAIGNREAPIPEHVDIFHLKREMPPSDKTALECVMEVDEEKRRLEHEAEVLAVKDSEGW